MGKESLERIEDKSAVEAYIHNLRYALTHGATITFQDARKVDVNRQTKYTNSYTVANLFKDEDPVEALKRELLTLNVENYMKTVKDIRFPKRAEMRVFGKVYNGDADVYIKIRVELLGLYGMATTFVMSFHFAERPFTSAMFPYRKEKGETST